MRLALLAGLASVGGMSILLLLVGKELPRELREALSLLLFFCGAALVALITSVTKNSDGND